MQEVVQETLEGAASRHAGALTERGGPRRHGGASLCRRGRFWGSPCGSFRYKNSRRGWTVAMRGLDGNFEPTVGPKTRHGTQKVQNKLFKSYFFGPLCVTLGRLCEKNSTLRETYYLLCFDLILRVLTHHFSPSKWLRECTVHQKRSF